MPPVPQHVIDDIRSAADIVDIVSDYVSLKRAGRNFLGLCPFHAEKTPSFNVNAEKQFFHCFGCGTGGNVFAFVQRIEGIGFLEALKTLAKRSGIEIPEPESKHSAAGQEKEALLFANQLAAEFFQQCLFSTAGKVGLEYLRQRALSDEALRTFGVGFAPEGWENLVHHARSKSANLEVLAQAGLIAPREKDGRSDGYYDRFRTRVMFPIYNFSGRVVAFGGRRIIDDDSPKYINSPESLIYHKGELLYGLTHGRDAIKKADCLIVVEGYLDLIRMHLCGFQHAVATSGTALTEAQARAILRYTKNVILLFDSDAAGSAATLRGADILVESGLSVRVATLDAGEDPDSFLRKNPAEDMQRILEAAPSLLEFKILNPSRMAPKREISTLKDDRTEQLRSIIETLARIKDGLERQSVVHRIAEQLRVDESVLWEEVARLRRSRLPRQAGAPQRSSAKSGQPNPQVLQRRPYSERCRAIELDLIRVMVLHWDAIQFVFSFMRLEDFHDPDARAMAEVFHSLLERAVPLASEDLLRFFHEPQQAAFVSGVINKEASTPPMGAKGGNPIEVDYRRWCADCMTRLQRFMIEDQMAEIRNQIKEGEKNGLDVTEFMQQFDECQKHLRKIKPENFLITTSAPPK